MANAGDSNYVFNSWQMASIVILAYVLGVLVGGYGVYVYVETMGWLPEGWELAAVFR